MSHVLTVYDPPILVVYLDDGEAHETVTETVTVNGEPVTVNGEVVTITR